MPDSSWKEPYHQALKESDEQKLTELVHAAEYAIVLRLQELENCTDHQEERAELKRATADLLVITTRLASHSRGVTTRGLPSSTPCEEEALDPCPSFATMPSQMGEAWRPVFYCVPVPRLRQECSASGFDLLP
jgi:hypothetical protein